MSKSLELIDREIARLEAKSADSSTGLSLEDVKKLRLLIESGQALIQQPVTSTPESSPAASLSDEELDAAIKPSQE